MTHHRSSSALDSSRSARIRRPREVSTGRITPIEAVSYTAVIAFIALVASGVFDTMLPWR